MHTPSSEKLSVKILHAGSLTTLVQQRLTPALLQAHAMTLESEGGHSVALAQAIKTERLCGDVFHSADAEVNELLLGPENGEWAKWFVIFARNAVVLAYSPKSQFLADFERASSGAIPWYQPLLQPDIKLNRHDPNL